MERQQSSSEWDQAKKWVTFAKGLETTEKWPERIVYGDNDSTFVDFELQEDTEPFSGEIDLLLLEELFAGQCDVLNTLKKPIVESRLGMEFFYDSCPDPVFDKGRGKVANETKSDIKNRYKNYLKEFM